MRKVMFAAGAMALAMSPARADVTSFFGINPFPVSQYGTSYMSLGGGVLVRQIPRFNVPFSAREGTGPIYSNKTSVVMGGGGFTIGFRIKPLGIGSKSRVELAFGGWTGGTRKTSGEGTLPLLSISSIDGSTVTLGCLRCVSENTLKIRHSELGGVLRFKTDFSLGKRWSATPSIGFLGNHSQTRYRSDTPFDFPIGGVAVPRWVKETVSTRRLGGEFGLDVGVRATKRLSLEAGVAVAIFNMHSKLSGSDCQSSAQPPGMACRPGAFGFGTTIENSDSHFGVRVSMRVTATYDTGWLKLSLTGFGGWDNAAPGVRNPNTANDLPNGSASIYYDQSWTYGGALLATFPFFR